jgi:hypothetical protein
MRIRRTLPIVLAVVIVAAAVTLAVQLRKLAPPEAARLLPGADAYLYIDLGSARKANSGKDLPAVSHDPEYERFIRETGFQFERDLDEAAFAVHYPSSSNGRGGTARPALEPRFSEVLVGKFNGERLIAYLRQIAKSVETYHSAEIFTIAVEKRSLRVAVLSADSVAASNHDDPAVIRGMIDRSTRLASPFGGPALLRQYYKHVQLASLAWTVARVEPSPGDLSIWSTLFSQPATVVISGSYLSPLHLRAEAIRLRAEAFTQNPEQAHEIAERLNSFVALAHTAETSAGTHGTDPDVKALFDNVKIKEEGSRTILTAAMPFGFLRKMLAGSAADAGEPTPLLELPAKAR